MANTRLTQIIFEGGWARFLSGMAHLGMDQLGYLFPPFASRRRSCPFMVGSRDKDFPRVGGIGDIDRAQLGSSEAA